MRTIKSILGFVFLCWCYSIMAASTRREPESRDIQLAVLSHPNVAMCMGNLDILMQATAREPEAEALFKSAMELLEKRLGSAHHLTAYTKSNFADFLSVTGRVAEALPLAREALESLRAALPAGHRYNEWARAVLKRARAQLRNGTRLSRERATKV